MNSSRVLCIIAASGLAVSLLSRNVAAATSGDPANLVMGTIQSADTPAARETALQLLSEARNNYALRSLGQGYDLKVSFTVNSSGETLYDGAWQMEDIFDPHQGLRWTANAGAAYSITEISANGKFYSEGTEGHIPLRLQEARAALLDSIPSTAFLNRAAVRTATATFQGAPLACVLFSTARGAAAAEPGRSWQETEDCVDPRSGMLMVHSQAPGRYYAYDYTDARQFAGKTFPRRVMVIEAGRTVSLISVDSLTQLPSADENLFVPTSAMLQRGHAVMMGGAQKVAHVVAQGAVSSGAPVCIFGVVNASGKLVEAHSLQPDDPNSVAAVQAASQMNFLRPTPGVVGAPPEQHFAFVFVRFTAQSQ